MASATNRRNVNLDKLLYKGVGRQLTHVSRTYESLLRIKIAEPLNINPAFQAQKTWRDMTIPSAALTNYTQAIRLGVDDQKSDVIHENQLSNSGRPGDELEYLLEELSPDFVDIRRGSWDALNSDNPDKLRQAAGSYRELVRMVLAMLMPNSRRRRDVRAEWRGSDRRSSWR